MNQEKERTCPFPCISTSQRTVPRLLQRKMAIFSYTGRSHLSHIMDVIV